MEKSKSLGEPSRASTEEAISAFITGLESVHHAHIATAFAKLLIFHPLLRIYS